MDLLHWFPFPLSLFSHKVHTLYLCVGTEVYISEADHFNIVFNFKMIKYCIFVDVNVVVNEQ